ncbi:MAG TPA: tetratricopeptide repeat protein [Planctomycetota bacterium]|nr:tetratricopeptide repeat protein [Planctomycetota bacterium]
MTQNYTNLSVKAGLLEALGHTAEAAPLRQQAVAVATEPELNTLGYQYLQSKQMEKALELFKANVAAHPESWNTHDSLAEACQMSGDTKTAIEHYRKALELVKDDTNKARIAGTLEQLGAM